jgi:hypothetical protein
MRRYAGLGLILIAALMIGGCGESEPETPSTPAPVDNTLPQAEATEPAQFGEPPEPEAQADGSEAAAEKPTVLGAIGRAVAETLAGSGAQDEASEAPAYQGNP